MIQHMPVKKALETLEATEFFKNLWLRTKQVVKDDWNDVWCVIATAGVQHINTCNLLYFCAIIQYSICFYYTLIHHGHAPAWCRE